MYKKVTLYLEESKLDNEDFDNSIDGNVEWVDEESEISLFASPYVDKNHDQYPSTGRMYVRTNKGNYQVVRLRDEEIEIDEEDFDDIELLIKLLDNEE